MPSNRERWSITVELPPGIANGGRFMARMLKHLGRSWRVRCSALDVDAEVLRRQSIIEGMPERIAHQAQLLARNAERKQLQ